MKKIFLSLPMRGRKDEDIQKTIDKMKDIVKAYYPNDDIEFMHNFNPLITREVESLKKVDPELIKKEGVWYLSYAVRQIAQADVIATITSYNGEWCFNGCCIESEVARRYDIPELRLSDNNGYLLPDLKEMAVPAKTSIPEDECVCGCE